MKTILLLLLSATCYGQVYTVNKDGDTINTAYGMKSADKVTTGNYSIPIGVTDTPLSYRNPNDFYRDTNAFLGIGFINADQPIKTTKIIIEGDTTMEYTSKENNIYNLLTINQLLLYAEECWNDSSKYCYRKVCDWYCVEIACDCNAPKRYMDVYDVSGNIISEEVMPCAMKYIHRKPTFEHFIEWLKKK